MSDGVEMDQFGWSVAIDGSTVVIGALKDEDKASSVTDSGAVYVFDLIFSRPVRRTAPPANGAVGDCTSSWRRIFVSPTRPGIRRIRAEHM